MYIYIYMYIERESFSAAAADIYIYIRIAPPPLAHVTKYVASSVISIHTSVKTIRSVMLSAGPE